MYRFHFFMSSLSQCMHDVYLDVVLTMWIVISNFTYIYFLSVASVEYTS